MHFIDNVEKGLRNVENCRTFVSNKNEMETLKYTYWNKAREYKVVAGENWNGEFFMEWKTPNGYPRANYYSTAKECIKAFNRKTKNQTL